MPVTKRKYYLFFIFFILQFGKVKPQQKALPAKDSMVFILKLNTIDDILNKKDFFHATAICENVLQYFKKNNSIKGEAQALIKLNEVHFAINQYKKSIDNVNRIFEIGQSLSDKKIMGIGLLQKAQYFMYSNKLMEAEKLFEKALTYLPEKDTYTAFAWNERGYNYSHIGELQKQADCYLKALQLFEKENHQSGIAIVYTNLSEMYHQINKTTDAIKYIKKSISIRETLKDHYGLFNNYSNLSQYYLDINLKEAEKYAVLCKNLAEENNDENQMITALNNIGLVKDREGKKSENVKLALQILTILENKENPSIALARQYLAVGIIHSELKQDSLTALNYINKGINMAIDLGDKISIRDGFFAKTIFFKIRNDFYNAYENIKKYHLYKDSIISSNTISNISELQTKYETDKKDNEINRLYDEQKIKELRIAQLNTEQKIKQLAIEKQKAVIAGNEALAKQKQDELDLLMQKKALQDLELVKKAEALDKQLLLAQSQKQQLDIAEKEKQLDAAALRNQKQVRNIIIGIGFFIIALAGILFNRYQLKKKIQEQQNLLAVRDNIAKDLHDDVGSTLSSIKILSEISYKNIDKDNTKAASILKKVIEQSEDMQQGISDIVWSVKPDNDKLENIVIRMREHAGQTLESKKINVVFEIDEALMMNQIGMQQRRDLLLIYKEGINNITKYANAKDVKIKITKKDSSIQLSIQDNGRGFDMQEIKSGNGLKNMKSRTEKLNGIFNLYSAKNSGTKIQVTIPLT